MDPEPFAERCRRAGEVARAAGADALLVADPATLRWLTGREQEIEYGPLRPVSAGTLVQLGPDGTGRIVCPVDDAASGPSVAGLEVRAYEGYTIGPLRPYANALACLEPVPFLAIEADAVSASLVHGRRWVDVTAELRWLRAVKDRAEIAGIHDACRVASAGQRAFRAAAAPGRREIEVFSEVHAAMEAMAGRRVAVLPDLMSGTRMMEVGRPPTDRRIGAHELVLCDLEARHAGHWSDSCTTICAGSPTSEMRRLHAAVQRTLDELIAAARPGALAGALDLLARSRMADAGYRYPHHTGHGIGAGFHEEPRIVPDAPAVIEAGMVLALEPAGFGGGIGARIEHIIHVAQGGNEMLTDYDTRLER
jgi:Xaa-Pro aminopeptidase